MKTQSIEIHHTRAEGRRIYVDYTIYEGETLANVTQEFKMFDLIEFVKEEELNWNYINQPDVLVEQDAYTYLTDNMDEICKLYIESKLEEVNS